MSTSQHNIYSLKAGHVTDVKADTAVGTTARRQPLPFSPHGALQVFGDDLVAEPTRDGWDYSRICGQHLWASRPAHTPDLTDRCPFCAVAFHASHGRLRYATIQTRLVLGF